MARCRILFAVKFAFQHCLVWSVRQCSTDSIDERAPLSTIGQPPFKVLFITRWCSQAKTRITRRLHWPVFSLFLFKFPNQKLIQNGIKFWARNSKFAFYRRNFKIEIKNLHCSAGPLHGFRSFFYSKEMSSLWLYRCRSSLLKHATCSAFDKMHRSSQTCKLKTIQVSFKKVKRNKNLHHLFGTVCVSLPLS